MNWRNTIQAGPGAAQWVLDDLELGPRVAIPWSSGRRWCAWTRAERLRCVDEPVQQSLFGEGR